MAAIGSNIPSLRRQIKNVACNYSEAQIKVREATSNDPWGPSSSLMSEVADLTYNAMAFTEIMQMIWKRLSDHGKNWRHVYKSLVLLDYILKVGSDKVAQQCRENIYTIQTLKDFQHIEENKDQGMNVREKAKQLVAMLKDDERLKNERSKALMAKKRFTQNGMGIGSDGSTSQMRRPDGFSGDEFDPAFGDDAAVAGVRVRTGSAVMRRGVSVPNLNSELEECRPASIGEEELQLQIALALSKEEAERENETKKNDDVRLQLALHESTKELERRNTLSGGESPTAMLAAAAASPRKHTSAIDDLLSLDSGVRGANSSLDADDPFRTPRVSNDPWGTSGGAASADPWGASHQPTTTFDSFAPLGQETPRSNDPWSSSFQPLPTANVSDPFNLSFGGGGGSMLAPVEPTSANPWGGDMSVQNEMNGLNEQWTNNKSTGANVEMNPAPATRQLKTPESFLGENSSLVNLDNLMMSTKATPIGVPPRATSANSNTSATNPFAATQQRATPTLNEMRTNQPQQISWGANQANSSWNAPATNPFL